MTVAELHSGCCSSVEKKMLLVYVHICSLKLVFSEDFSNLSVYGSTPTSTKRKPDLHPSSMELENHTVSIKTVMAGLVWAAVLCEYKTK